MRVGRGAETQAGVFFFRGGKETCGFDRVGQEEGRTDAYEDGNNPFYNKDPSPALESSSWPYGIEAAGEEAAKGTRERGRRVEDADAEGEFLSAVEVREIQDLAEAVRKNVWVYMWKW